MRLLLVLLLICNFGFSQSNLSEFKFDTDYYKSVDQWVAFPKVEEDSVYNFGFIFLDVHKGFSYKYESKFTAEGEKIKQVKNDTTVGFVKFILDENTKKVSVLTKAQKKDLGLPEQPSWLQAYKKGNDKVNYLVKQGFYYNAVGASDLALEPLLEAYKKEPHHPRLEYELGFAYNALGNFEKAVTILEKAIDNDPLNIEFYKEIGYSFENLKNNQEAEKMYRLGMSISDDENFKLSMSLRLIQLYFNSKNKSKFEEWANKILTLTKNDPQSQKFINSLLISWDKER